MAVFAPGLIFIHPRLRKSASGSDKEAYLSDMVEVLREHDFLGKTGHIFSKLMDREKDFSTGIGNHIAIPHIRDEDIKAFKAVIYLLDKEIDFNSLDEKGVKLIILFAVPEKEGNSYMKILGKVSEFLRDPEKRDSIFNTTNRQELYKQFRRLEHV